jgi:uncharacterized protein (TIGR02145 family)
VSVLSPPVVNAVTNSTCTSFTANWSAVPGTTFYSLDVSYDVSFTANDFVTVYSATYTPYGQDPGTILQNFNTGASTSYTVANFIGGATAYYRVKANTSACVTGYSGTMTVAAVAGCNPSCGLQVWYPTNLETGQSTTVTGSTTQNGSVEWCYSNSYTNCVTYGGLFQWSDALGLSSTYLTNSPSGDPTAWQTCDPCGTSGLQGQCPPNYHIPTKPEWERYSYCVENNQANYSLPSFQGGGLGNVVGTRLKATSWNGNNFSGFNALPAGYTTNGTTFSSMGSWTWFWTADDSDSSDGEILLLSSSTGLGTWANDAKSWGVSIRCLHN